MSSQAYPKLDAHPQVRAHAAPRVRHESVSPPRKQRLLEMRHGNGAPRDADFPELVEKSRRRCGDPVLLLHRPGAAKPRRKSPRGSN